MLPGSHRRRMTYGPALSGSPARTAVSCVPAAFLTHLILSGVVNSTPGPMACCAEPNAGPSIIVERARACTRVARVMMPPLGRVRFHALGRNSPPGSRLLDLLQQLLRLLLELTILRRPIGMQRSIENRLRLATRIVL